MESLIVYIIVTIVVFKGTYCFNSTNLKNGENQFISHKLYRIYPTSVENLEILNAMRSTSILNFKVFLKIFCKVCDQRFSNVINLAIFLERTNKD